MPELDILYETKKDRRLLANVPDKDGIRTNIDRRSNGAKADILNGDFATYIDKDEKGRRYSVNYPAIVEYKDDRGKKRKVNAIVTDISTTGLLLETLTDAEKIAGDNFRLTFEITPGSMPEGYEMKVKRLPSRLVRSFQGTNGHSLYGFAFKSTLSEYSNSRRGRWLLAFSALSLLVIVTIILMMRAESVIYFKFNRYLYLYSIIAAAFLLSRYFFAVFYRSIPIDPTFTPGVTVIIPCFNEEEWIQRTILGAINQDYPVDKLEVIVIDDCSTDHSVDKIKEIVERIYEEDTYYDTKSRLSYYIQPRNMGKRDAMAVGAKLAKNELLVFVDSDSFLDPFAIRNIVQPFKDKEMGGVCGRTDVANTYTNAITKMQAVRYYIAFRVMKAAEGVFDAATCLSGPLSCYRRDLVLKYCDDWLNQQFFGRKATFGDDRSMTNFILRHDRTTYQDTAICSTIVPNSLKMFLKQQMRWKRSWLRESLIAARFMWKKEPFMALSFYMGLIVPIIAPVIVIYNLVYIPIVHRIFPSTFLVGMLMMALMMSMAQLFLRRSSTWLFGMWFCLFYEGILLWQMPFAWFTFWKSTWGTRMTDADVAEANKKNEKNNVSAPTSEVANKAKNIDRQIPIEKTEDEAPDEEFAIFSASTDFATAADAPKTKETPAMRRKNRATKEQKTTPAKTLAAKEKENQAIYDQEGTEKAEYNDTLEKTLPPANNIPLEKAAAKMSENKPDDVMTDDFEFVIFGADSDTDVLSQEETTSTGNQDFSPISNTAKNSGKKIAAKKVAKPKNIAVRTDDVRLADNDDIVINAEFTDLESPSSHSKTETAANEQNDQAEPSGFFFIKDEMDTFNTERTAEEISFESDTKEKASQLESDNPEVDSLYRRRRQRRSNRRFVGERRTQPKE